VMIPQIMSVIQMRFGGSARAKALSIYAVVLSVGAVFGLVLGPACACCSAGSFSLQVREGGRIRCGCVGRDMSHSWPAAARVRHNRRRSLPLGCRTGSGGGGGGNKE
jgi:MFS family permease